MGVGEEEWVEREGVEKEKEKGWLVKGGQEEEWGEEGVKPD
jgi:hypothetical protein